MSKIVVDTNIILLSANNLISVPQSFNCTEVILPETVIDEIDGKKSGHSELAFQAREFGRLLSKAERIKVVETTDLTSTYLKLDDIIIHIASAKSYPKFNDDETSIRNDRKIIHIAELCSKLDSETTLFCSNDVMCRIRAESLGLTVVDYKEVENVDIEFVRTITLSDELFHQEFTSPLDIDANYTTNIYSYKVVNAYSGQMKFYTVVNGQLSLITGTEEAYLRKQEMPPINNDQLLFSSLIQNRNVDIVVCDALAGSGKTVTAISNAMQLVGSNTPYTNIVYIRNSVDDVGERDEEIGFLSGNDEKVKGYLYPFYDTLDSIVRKTIKTKSKSEDIELLVQEGIAKLMGKYQMQAIIALGTRGRTFDNSIIIIDEGQNLGKNTMQKLLTRIGKNCKLIIIGSLKQIDSKYLNKFTSGLSIILASTLHTYSGVTIAGVSLTKVVRGPITEWAENLFSS